MAFEKRGYERQEETEIPSLLRKYGDMQYNNRRENHMFANYWEIQNRVKYIKEELSHIEAVEKEMPAGELIVAKNNKNYKWYFHNQNTTIYLPKKEIELARKYVDEVMQTKYSSIEQEIGKLSGGNQQKVIISRWLLVTEKILILDEPTRGIDVKTKSDIYHLIDDLTATGLSIIFISSEMPELINMCDRIVVMNQGHTTGILNRNEFNQEKIMAFATKEIG